MPMRDQGRAKLTEEAGEVLQILGKMQQYPNQDAHPDGLGSLRQRLWEELADLAGSVMFVMDAMEMTEDEFQAFLARREEKYNLFHQWAAEER